MHDVLIFENVQKKQKKNSNSYIVIHWYMLFLVILPIVLILVSAKNWIFRHKIKLEIHLKYHKNTLTYLCVYASTWLLLPSCHLIFFLNCDVHASNWKNLKLVWFVDVMIFTIHICCGLVIELQNYLWVVLGILTTILNMFLLFIL